MRDTRWVDRYMAIPFRERGRSWKACDCFGLYGLMVATECGVMIDDIDVSFSDDPADIGAVVSERLATGGWLRIERHLHRAFDAVQMRSYHKGGASDELHIGCATGAGTLVHIERHVGVRHLPLDHEHIAHRIIAFWRPQALVK